MMKNVLDLLNTSEFYGVSENIEIAKGKYELPTGWKDAFNKIKRHRKTKKEVITWKSLWNKIIKSNRWQRKR
jgi:hypothetical protein